MPEELQTALENDFELGEIFKSRLIRHAVDWFTGKALEYEDNDGDVRGTAGAGRTSVDALPNARF